MKGIAKYEEFWQYQPRSVGYFSDSFKIPRHVVCVGFAVHVLYRSDKRNPSTSEDEGEIDYIHEHKKGVKLYLVEDDGPQREVPGFIADAEVLVLLGDCMGFAWEEDGETIEAEARNLLPELYTIPSGKALLVVESKRRVTAMIWGGKLGVEGRGIVG